MSQDYAFGQSIDQAVIKGKVLDLVSGEPIDFVTVYVKNSNQATETSLNGRYKLNVSANESFVLVFSRLGYKEAKETIKAIPSGSEKYVDVKLAALESDLEVIVTENRIEELGMIRESVEALRLLPSTSGNFESILPNIALGTTGGTGGELSAQYNVRGGNYDENLIYVNDFEIFRPQLIRNGQQEGLSFPNVDLMRDLSFSSGGFEAKYGDKMSSVLDIRYKRPEDFRASAEASFLGATAHIEGSKQIGPNPYNKLRFLTGARYKTNQYLLGSLDVTGQYNPAFSDIQTYFTYDINKDWQVGAIANYNRSIFNFVPRQRSTAVGSIDFAVRLTTNFEGAEADQFINGMSGVSLTYLPDREKNPIYLKLLASRYSSVEEEAFDLIGDYRISQIETNFGSENAGQEIAVLGTGVQQNFGRNRLRSQITNIQHKGGIELGVGGESDRDASHFIQWGIKWQEEIHKDRLNEWERLDSAGYSLPFDENAVRIFDVLKSENEINSYRINTFLQNTYSNRLPGRSELKATLGLRSSYWSLNQQLLLSPRGQLLYKPLSWQRDVSFKLAGGVYYQPPFYRELRRPDGSLNTDLGAQRSIHMLAGVTYDLLFRKISDKKFKVITELYYKQLDDLISYDIDNVRIRYSGENDATGYVTGLDFRINGEFVPGAESWINIGLLRARESIDGVDHMLRLPGDSLISTVNSVPRPTDQFFNLSMFFQDYLRSNENVKMHLNLFYGSGLPFGFPGDNIVTRNNFRFKAYQRVDIGFSWQLWRRDWRNRKPFHPFRGTDRVWFSMEVFNLLGIDNVASNTWIRTIFNTQFAIPNNLTGRRINLRMKVDF